MPRPDALEGQLHRFPYLQAFLEGDEEKEIRAAASLSASLDRKFTSISKGQLFLRLSRLEDIEEYFRQVGLNEELQRVIYQASQVTFGYEIGDYGLVVSARKRVLAKFQRDPGVDQLLEARVHDGWLRAGVFLNQALPGSIGHEELIRTAFPPQDPSRN